MSKTLSIIDYFKCVKSLLYGQHWLHLLKYLQIIGRKFLIRYLVDLVSQPLSQTIQIQTSILLVAHGNVGFYVFIS